ncbi:MAG: hypothetical protein A2X86_15875 [Bdellovibrionales bacterium GWA2_49_15]|nr:MAG: hypothetical protein A2X86_15875 [Bdellovibrionales bacterium GWA2_49_15]HAZ12416.1 hypothetical protein [Bdellovibrionales bacterium]
MKRNFFKQIDQALMQQVAKIEARSEYQRFQEFLSSLNEKEKKVVSQTIHLGLIILPLLLILPVWFSNWSLKRSIEEKKELVKTYEQYIKSKENLEVSGQNIYAAGRIDTEQEAQVKIKSYAQRFSIDTNKVAVVNYQPGLASDNLKETRMQVKFQGLALVEFSDFLGSLMNLEKFKISNIRIERDQTSLLLQGHIGLNHFARGL